MKTDPPRDHRSISAAMAGQGVTNGWDAVCALDSAALTQLLLQAWLYEGPTARSQQLQAVVPVDASTYALVDVGVGPPVLSFPSTVGPGQAWLTRFVLSGWYLTFDASTMVLQCAVPQEPDTATLAGALDLAKAQGEQDQVGQLVLQLGSGAWTPALSGVDPTSEVNTSLATAVLTYYQNQSTTYPLGVVAAGAPTGMNPTDFSFVTAQAGDGSGATCVQLLVQTTGSGGPVQPVSPYPIPDQQTAALVLSNQTFFGAALPAALNGGVLGTQMGATAAGQSTSGGWQTQLTNGSFDIGQLGTFGSDTTPYTSVSVAGGKSALPPAGADAVIPVGGTFSQSGGNLQFQWSSDWTQTWTSAAVASAAETGTTAAAGPAAGGLSVLYYTSDVPFGVSMTWNGQPSVAPSSTNMVTFSDPSNPTPTVQGTGSGWEKFWNQTIIAQFEEQSAGPLQQAFGSFPFPDISTFSLANLLLPGHAGFAMQFADVSLPYDLLITGNLPSTLQMTPSPIDLTPGGTTQISATSNGSAAAVTWTAQLGTIDANGNYTAPATVNGVAADVVTATLDGDNSASGRVLILVAEAPAATALTVDPPAFTLTAGQSCILRVTDDTGALVSGPPPALADGCGTIVQASFQPSGVWTYTAPATLTAAAAVPLSFVSGSDPSQAGAATANLVTTEAVTVTASGSTTLSAGGQVHLSASAATIELFNWVPSPAGIGTIQGDGGSAVYTAPSPIAIDQTITVVAYAVGAEVAGVGTITLSLSASSGNAAA